MILSRAWGHPYLPSAVAYSVSQGIIDVVKFDLGEHSEVNI
jgi:hypothetical protein